MIPENKYKEIIELMPIVCVDVIIYYKNKVLLVKRKNEPAVGEWWMPGGRLLKNETLENAAIRKAHEETGLKVRIVRPLIFGETIFKESNLEGIKTGTHTVNVSYLLEAENDKVRLDSQSSNFIWADKIDKSWPQYVIDVIESSRIFNK